MESTTTPRMLALFADHIDREGIELVPADVLAALVGAARRIGASEVLLGVLIDPTEPAVARERAFAKLASRLIGVSAPPCTRSLADAVSLRPSGSPRDSGLLRDSRLARGQTPIVTRPGIAPQV